MARSLPQRVLVSLSIALLIAACSTGGPSAAPPTTSPGASTGCVPPTAKPACEPGATATPAATTAPTEPASAAPSPEPDAGTAREDAHGVDQVWVPGGVFTMGSEATTFDGPAWARRGFDSEHPAHEVRVTRGYWIDVTEVTVEDYAAFKDAGGYEDQALWSAEGWTWLQGMGTAALPAGFTNEAQAPTEPQVCVTWFEAEAYAAWRGGRLPTEAEWEFAARGPESNVYPWGNEFDAALANLDGATGPVPVGNYPGGASWVGALDMAGNAMEWVNDWWSVDYYRDAPHEDPQGPASGSIKIEKGGWWGPPDNAGEFIGRSAFKLDEDPPTYSDHHIGFRIVTVD